MKIRYHSIVPHSHVDGPGDRTVLFLQGCSIRCPGCQSPDLWDASGGREVEVSELAAGLWKATARPAQVTISGGEPTDQPQALLSLLIDLRFLDPSTHIILYSGRTMQQIIDHLGERLAWRIFFLVDVLVDGPYIADLDDDYIQHRGSRNQRAIDMPATIDTGEIALLDWDRPELRISLSGQITAAAGLAGDLALDDLGDQVAGRICGESSRKPNTRSYGSERGEPSNQGSRENREGAR